MTLPTTDREGVEQAVRAIRAKGWVLMHVDYGDDETETVSTVGEAVKAVMAVDDAYLVVAEGTPTGRRAWVRFVMGNEPDEVICDYTLSLSAALDPLIDGWIDEADDDD